MQAAARFCEVGSTFETLFFQACNAAGCVPGTDPRVIAAELGLRVVALAAGPDAAADAHCIVFRVDSSESETRSRAALALAFSLFVRAGLPHCVSDARALASRF